MKKNSHKQNYKQAHIPVAIFLSLKKKKKITITYQIAMKLTTVLTKKDNKMMDDNNEDDKDLQ